MVRNEADRFLPKLLPIWAEFADKIKILDDGSTDDLESVCGPHDVQIRRTDVGMYGNRGEGRRELWEYAVEGEEPGTWILVLDADMTPADDPRPWAKGHRIAFRTFDMWSYSHYRDDVFWQRPWRTWAVRLTSKEGKWRGSDAHTDHFPYNYGTGYSTPCPVPMLHYAYATPESRKRQADKYQGLELTKAERAHADTILDEKPRTLPLGDVRWRL